MTIAVANLAEAYLLLQELQQVNDTKAATAALPANTTVALDFRAGPTALGRITLDRDQALNNLEGRAQRIRTRMRNLGVDIVEPT